ncbi:12880_t:CDS:1, partial [Entrophospora sp. SA101]
NIWHISNDTEIDFYRLNRSSYNIKTLTLDENIINQENETKYLKA